MTSGRAATKLMVLATDLAELASALHRARLQVERLVDTKSSDSDFVSDVDRDAEAVIVERLFARRPHDGVLAEEGSFGEGTSGVRWIIDPLDGTTNFLRGYPSFGCSIAVEVDGRALLEFGGCVVSDSVGKATYAAVVDHGATCGGRPISLRPPPPSLAGALVSTGFSYHAEQRRLQGAVMAQVIEHIADIRRSGAAALDLCLLAAGSVDAFFSFIWHPGTTQPGASSPQRLVLGCFICRVPMDKAQQS